MNKYISLKESKKLSRNIHNLPDYINKKLVEKKLVEKYQSRPAYQRNDYIGWITRAKTQETQEKRLDQMLQELTQGDLYMKMSYSK
jgi:uncharacterized protein YdeI (YjbR/CyaY-like superfamily)